MGRPKLTTRETKIAQRVIDRKKLLKRAAIVGYTRPEGFGYFDDVIVEEKVEKKATKKAAKVVDNIETVETTNTVESTEEVKSEE